MGRHTSTRTLDRDPSGKSPRHQMESGPSPPRTERESACAVCVAAGPATAARLSRAGVLLLPFDLNGRRGTRQEDGPASRTRPRQQPPPHSRRRRRRRRGASTPAPCGVGVLAPPGCGPVFFGRWAATHAASQSIEALILISAAAEAFRFGCQELGDATPRRSPSSHASLFLCFPHPACCCHAGT